MHAHTKESAKNEHFPSPLTSPTLSRAETLRLRKSRAIARQRHRAQARARKQLYLTYATMGVSWFGGDAR